MTVLWACVLMCNAERSTQSANLALDVLPMQWPSHWTVGTVGSNLGSELDSIANSNLKDIFLSKMAPPVKQGLFASKSAQATLPENKWAVFLPSAMQIEVHVDPFVPGLTKKIFLHFLDVFLHYMASEEDPHQQDHYLEPGHVDEAFAEVGVSVHSGHRNGLTNRMTFRAFIQISQEARSNIVGQIIPHIMGGRPTISVKQAPAIVGMLMQSYPQLFTPEKGQELQDYILSYDGVRTNGIMMMTHSQVTEALLPYFCGV